MTSYHKELERLAQLINTMDELAYEIHVNRRNGWYAVDKFDKNNKQFLGAFRIGDYKEIKSYLLGMENALWFSKPF